MSQIATDGVAVQATNESSESQTPHADLAVPNNGDLLTSKHAGKIWGVSKDGWNKLVRNGIAPQPVVKRPPRWSRQQLAEMKKTILSIEKTQAKLKREAEQRRIKGPWVLVEDCGTSWESFFNWRKDGLLVEGDDWVKVAVKGNKGESTRTVKRNFVRQIAIDELKALETDRRRDSAEKSWTDPNADRPKETLIEGKKTLILVRAAARKFGVTRTTIGYWCDKDRKDCPLGRALNEYWRDAAGNATAPPSDGTRKTGVYLSNGKPTYRYLDNADIEKTADVLASLTYTSVEKAADDVYSIGTVSRLTGIPINDLSRKEKTKALHLVRVKIPLNLTCQRDKGKDPPTNRKTRAKKKNRYAKRTRTLAFTKSSVDALVKSGYRGPMFKQGTPGTMTLVDAAAWIGVSRRVVSQWLKKDLLVRAGREEYWSNAGRRTGIRQTATSVDAAKKIFIGANFDVAEAAKLLEAQRDEREKAKAEHEAKENVKTLANGIPEPTSAKTSSPMRSNRESGAGTASGKCQHKYPGHTRKPRGRGPDPDTGRETMLEFSYDHFVTKKMESAKVLAAMKSRFGESSPIRTDAVREFAREWSNKFIPPLPMRTQTACS